MKRTVGLVAVLLVGWLAPARAEETDPVFKSIPDNAWVVGVAHAMAETGNKLAAAGGKLQLAAANPVAIAKVMLGLGEGLDEQGSLAVVLFPPKHEGDAPMVALYVQVTDYAQFIKPLRPHELGHDLSRVTVANHEVLVTHKDDFAVFARTEHEEALKKILSTSEGIEKVVEPVSPWLARQDIAILALPKAIEFGTKLAEQSLAQAAQELEAGGEQMKPALAMFGMYQQILATIGDELTHGGMGLKIEEAGDVLLSFEGAVDPKGDFAKSLASITWPKRLGLAQIPAGDYAVATAMAFPHEWAEAWTRYNLLMLSSLKGAGQPLSEEETKELTKSLIASIEEFKAAAFVVRPIKAGEGILDRTSGIMLCHDSEHYLKEYPELMKKIGRIMASAKPGGAAQSVKPVKIGDRDGYEMSMDMNAMFKQMEPADPITDVLKKKLVGEDGTITTYIAAADRETIAMTYGSKETLTGLIDSTEGLATDKGVKEVNGLLPADPAGVMYVSASGVIEFANAIMPMFDQDAKKLPEFPESPPVGMALKFVKRDVEARIAVTSRLLEMIGEYVTTLRAER